jgi:DNA-binding CsgD family transcriptional regulator
MVRVGTATPGLVTGESPEAAVVRRRAPILVPDAQANPRVHPQLKALTDTRDYICAPLVAQGRVVGLMHADRTRETGRVDQFDRDLLGLFAEGLGFVFERTYLAQRLQSIKLSLEAEARSVGDLVDSFFESGPLPAPAAHPRAEGGPLAELTRRELEVLRHLANGQTNVEIAADLFVSPGTVKCHVTSVLRKLGAANRAEAVSRYHRLSR